MALIRMGTPSTSMDATNAIIIHTDRVQIALRRSVIEGRTAAEIEAAIRAVAGARPLPAIFIHINRDDSIALAAGSEPDIWPEDWPQQPEGPR